MAIAACRGKPFHERHLLGEEQPGLSAENTVIAPYAFAFPH
jgi:hypothetical protein